MSLTLHLGLLGVAMLAVGAASVRIASSLVTSSSTRVLGAIAIGCGLVMAEPLLIGLTGHGSNSGLLTGAAILTWVVARAGVPIRDTPLRHQLAAELATASPASRGGIAALSTTVLGLTIWQLHRPRIGWDGTAFHVALPAVWIATGHPGGLHQTVQSFPTQAYPRSFEAIVFWAIAISRSMIVLTPLVMAFYLLVVVAMLVGLRRAGVPAVISTLAIAAALLIPWNLQEFGGVYNDLASVAFLAVTVVLAQSAEEEPAALGMAVVAAGLAIGVKTTTGPIAVFALLWAGWRVRHRLRDHLAGLVPLTTLGVLLGAVWYVINAVHYHAPGWPFSRFPSGPPQPYIWRTFGARLLHEPITTYRAIGWHNYLHYLGGIPILIVGTGVIALLTFLPGQRADRRRLWIGAAVVGFQTLVWSDAQFTGYAGVPSIVFSGQRYLDVAPFAAAAVLAVAARRRGVLRYLSIAILGFALAVDVVVAHRQAWAAGRIPGIATWVALVGVGTLAGLLSGYSGAVMTAMRRSATMPVLVVGSALLTAIPASSYLDNYLATGGAYDDGPVLDYLKTQPAWVHGDAPVAAGSAAQVTWAGVRFTHPLSWVPPNAPCSQLRTAATHGWLILVPATSAFAPLNYSLRPACLRGLTPVKQIRGADGQQPTLVYAPPALVSKSAQALG
jgi:hypothetical protein